MYMGQISFTILQIFGIWRPTFCDSKWKIWAYGAYSVFILTYYIIFMVFFFIYLLQVTEDIDRLTETVFNLCTTIGIFVKMMNIIVQRKTILDIKDMLTSKICQPRDAHESDILEKISQVCRFNTLVFLILTTCGAVLLFMDSLLKKDISLPFKTWNPFVLNSRLLFWLTYSYQGIAIFISTTISASVECLAMLIMLQICAQLDILIHRLHTLSNLPRKGDSESIIYQRESWIIKDCTVHHIYMYSLGKKLNALFGFVIFVQFFVSTISMCLLIYQMSRLNMNNPTCWKMISFSSIIIMQIFIYCFYGEKVADKSTAIAKAVWDINWVKLTNRTRKDLTVIMNRATKPIKLTGSSIIIMSIDTFVKIVKSAYSAYNLLKNTQEF